MKRIFLIAIITVCFCILGYSQDNKLKAGLILVKARKELTKNKTQVNEVFIESSSRYTVRKEKLKVGIIPSYEYGLKLWVQKPAQMKQRILTSYPDGSFQLTENTVYGNFLQNSIKIKGVGDNGFSPILFREKGDPKRNEEILLQKIKYEAFSLGFPVFLFPSEDLVFDYVGVAKSGDQNADVLATSIADTYKVKVFFDQRTHQLLLLSANFTEPKTGEAIEQKYFFSAYKEENGIKFAHKIIVHENGEIIEERDIKKIELNPKLEANFFEVKK